MKGGGAKAGDGARCVYTTLIGEYEQLNEQPEALRSSLPFICLTDDSDLRSETWELRLVTPLFGADPVRSQRDLKLRPHLHLPDFDGSLYVDNSVLLTRSPEEVFERYGVGAGLSVPLHSFRETVLDEFHEVIAQALDEGERVFEQLSHYVKDAPEVLRERPFWTGIMLRNHRDPEVVRALDVWAAHVQRYSRRDQLSFNMAVHHTGVVPQAIVIDNHSSWFHQWPRSTKRTMRAVAPTPASTWRAAVVMTEYAQRHPRIARALATSLRRARGGVVKLLRRRSR